MKQDLFDKRNNKQRLLDWIKQRGVVTSIDLLRYELERFDLRARRSARSWVYNKETNPTGPLRALTHDEKIFRGFVKKGDANIAIYEFMGGDDGKPTN